MRLNKRHSFAAGDRVMIDRWDDGIEAEARVMAISDGTVVVEPLEDTSNPKLEVQDPKPNRKKRRAQEAIARRRRKWQQL